MQIAEVPNADSVQALVRNNFGVQLTFHLGHKRLVVGPQAVPPLIQLRPEGGAAQLAGGVLHNKQCKSSDDKFSDQPSDGCQHAAAAAATHLIPIVLQLPACWTAGVAAAVTVAVGVATQPVRVGLALGMVVAVSVCLIIMIVPVLLFLHRRVHQLPLSTVEILLAR